MCHYTEILGEGGVLAIQLLTVASIALGIGIWVRTYRKEGIGLGAYALPIALWVLFGTLDIVVTAKGTFDDPLREGNPLARLVFMETGYFGPVVASVLWISLWALVVLIINKKLSAPLSVFLSLAVFYSLAVGHIYGFSSWFLPFCGLAEAYLSALGWIPRYGRMIPFGLVLAGAHMAVLRLAGSRR